MNSSNIHVTFSLYFPAYEHKQYASEDQFPNASASSRRVGGWRENHPPLLSLKACSSPNIQHNSTGFFLPQFWRNLIFQKYNQCGCRINGVRVNTLFFNECKCSITPNIEA